MPSTAPIPTASSTQTTNASSTQTTKTTAAHLSISPAAVGGRIETEYLNRIGKCALKNVAGEALLISTLPAGTQSIPARKESS